MQPSKVQTDSKCSFTPADGVENRLAASAAWLRGLRGWRRSAVAFAAGGVSMLAMAPTHLAPVLMITLPVLLCLTEGAQQGVGGKPAWRQVALTGWWFGFGYHLIGLYWIGFAFLVEADVFAWMLPFAVTLMPAGLAFFNAGALAIAGRAGLLEGAPLRQAAGLAIALGASDWLRGHILTGFPWNLLGYALTWPLLLMQSAGLVGIYGLSVLAVFIFAAPGLLLATSVPVAQRARNRTVAAGVLFVPLAALCFWGAVRLAAPVAADVDGVRMRLVQPSIAQDEKWRPERQREFFDRHLALSATAPDGSRDGLEGITHLIWAEASMPFMPLSRPEVMTMIGDLLPAGTQLLAGVLRIDEIGGQRYAFNSLAVFDDEGRPLSVYDKIHLVPFGEYLPFQRTLEAIGLEQLSRMRGGFTFGPKPRTLVASAGLPRLGILICYEAIFPGAVVQGPDRPGALVNVTNDGWFGATAGPYQHFHQSRLRAVEEGLPLVRVSNNGISAVFDPFGRVRASMPLNAVGVIDSTLPGSASPPPYAIIRDVPAVFGWLSLVFWLLVPRRRGT